MDAHTRMAWLQDAMPVPLTETPRADFGLAVGSEDGLTYAVTTDFSEVDTGVVRADDHATDLRTEILTVTTAGADSADVVLRAAAGMLAGAATAFPAQPGTILPGLAVRANLDFADFTVRHGALISPLLWGGPVPQYVEPEEQRMTLMLQLLLLRKEEYDFAQEHGLGELLQRAAEREVNLYDWSRGEWL